MRMAACMRYLVWYLIHYERWAKSCKLLASYALNLMLLVILICSGEHTVYTLASAELTKFTCCALNCSKQMWVVS